MRKIRIIPRLDIKGPNLIKGIHLEGLRVIGDPAEFATSYYKAGADELIYTDVVASLYGRNSLHDIITHTASRIFVPLTVGGGVRSVSDVESLLSVGADKISLNTAAIEDKTLITKIAEAFGSQCCVIEVQAKNVGQGRWTAMYNNGREQSGLDAVDWACEAVKLGAGEVLVTSIDKEGTRKGTDLALTAKIARSVNVPVIASGGVGSKEDVTEAAIEGHADAVAMADLFHYKRETIAGVKSALINSGIAVRSS